MINTYEAIEINKRKSLIIIFFFAVFILLSTYFIANAFSLYLGYEAGGLGIAGIALIISGFTTFIGYYFSDKIILTISKAKEAGRNEYFNFYTAAENLSIAAGIPKPKLFVIKNSAPNAFATGRDPNHAVVCVTTGLLEKLTKTELEGVIAHELSHIKHYDTRLMSIVSVLVGSIVLLADIFLRMGLRSRGKAKNKQNQISLVIMTLGLVFAILSPIVASLIKLAISRRREFFADADSVSITRQPSGLISALQKISKDKEALEVANKATAHLYITNPFKRKNHRTLSTFSNLFNTHPSIAERIIRLQKMA